MELLEVRGGAGDVGEACKVEAVDAKAGQSIPGEDQGLSIRSLVRVRLRPRHDCCGSLFEMIEYGRYQQQFPPCAVDFPRDTNYIGPHDAKITSRRSGDVGGQGPAYGGVLLQLPASR